MSLHPYSYNLGSESDERVHVSFRLAILSAFVSASIYLIYNEAVENKGYQFIEKYGILIKLFLTTPSVLGLFWVFYYNTCNTWWRAKFVRSALNITTPNLNGTWIGESITYYPNHDKRTRKARLVIWQDMRNIGICIDTPLHKIDSLGASIKRVADGWIISAHYWALRKLKRQEDLGGDNGLPENFCTQELGAPTDRFDRDFLGHHSHVGCLRIYVPDIDRWPTEEDSNLLKLQFYTDNQRMGNMSFKRVPTRQFPI